MLARLLAALLALFIAVPAAAKPAMWTVRDADSELVLFGSVHVLPVGLDWRPAAFDAALAKADDLWFELPTDEATQAEVARLAGANGFLPAGQKLSALLDKRANQRLAKAAQNLGVPLATLEAMRPWLAEVTLANAVFMNQGASRAEGVEAAVARSAPQKTERRAFETAAQQIALFADAPLADQLSSLRQTLKEIEAAPDGYDQLVKAWAKGDLKRLERDALDPVRKETPGVYRRLIVERNARWIEAIKARMAGSGGTVVVVGAGHLVGPDGLPARLRALGFQVEGP